MPDVLFARPNESFTAFLYYAHNAVRLLCFSVSHSDVLVAIVVPGFVIRCAVKDGHVFLSEAEVPEYHVEDLVVFLSEALVDVSLNMGAGWRPQRLLEVLNRLKEVFDRVDVDLQTFFSIFLWHFISS